VTHADTSSPTPTPSGAPTLPPVVPADDVARWLAQGSTDDGRPLVLADVRWYLDGRDGRAAYVDGHLPTAIWIDIDRHLARAGTPGVDWPATEGRHPLPTPEAFAATLGALGIGADAVVVAYDDTGGMTAGRLVVMLRMIGRDAALLDGGLGAWSGPLDTGEVHRTPTAVPVVPWPAERLADADTAAALAASPDGVAIDARAFERFTGEVALIDARPGHIPGARSAPWSAVLGADGRLLPPAALRDHFAARGIRPDASGRLPDVVASCGSGVSACMNLIALEHAGLPPARLYVASWSGWSADPDRPVALGGDEEPHGSQG
jgi:thiosulfate/3-mercaptopyruvate sulfurtransferase